MSSNIFLIIALITTGIFVIQFILSIFFGDIDTEIDVDADISSVVSFKGLTHFGIGFGWVHVSGRTYGCSQLHHRNINRSFLCVGCLVSL